MRLSGRAGVRRAQRTPGHFAGHRSFVFDVAALIFGWIANRHGEPCGFGDGRIVQFISAQGILGLARLQCRGGRVGQRDRDILDGIAVRRE